MDQNVQIYETETLRNWDGEDPSSGHLLPIFDLVIWGKERLKLPEPFAVLQKNNH